jgi:hypothetical protein
VKLGPLALDASSPLPWIGGAVMLLGGVLLLRITWRLVAAAWQAATSEARSARAGMTP